jgi:hypothetical protein
MNKIYLVLTILLTSISFGQSSMKEDVDIIQSIFGKEKKELINQYMNIATEHSTEFWKIYDEYETERKDLGQTKIKIVNEYASNYETLSNEKADELVKATLKNNMEYEKLNEKYYAKMKKVIGSIQAAKFIQVEGFVQNSVKSAILNSIPFIGEIERK